MIMMLLVVRAERSTPNSRPDSTHTYAYVCILAIEENGYPTLCPVRCRSRTTNDFANMANPVRL